MSATCTRCHRPLKTVRYTTPDGLPLGPTCARNARREAAAAHASMKPDTYARALEDLEDGAIIDTRRTTKAGHRIFAVVSSDGRDVYLATPGGACTCRCGLRGKYLCRHAAAARLIAA
jgi:hypothetical protein